MELLAFSSGPDASVSVPWTPERDWLLSGMIALDGEALLTSNPTLAIGDVRGGLPAGFRNDIVCYVSGAGGGFQLNIPISAGKTLFVSTTVGACEVLFYLEPAVRPAE